MHLQRIEREDIVHFLNACFACTGQKEFYDAADDRRVSIDFLHEYMLGNYRAIYARSLAAGINHFNQGRIILRLLATGRQAIPGEGALIARALATMPPQRAWKILRDVRSAGINNRRARAIARDFLRSRNTEFDAVKYRNKVKAVAVHNHLPLPGEMGTFFFQKTPPVFQTPLFEQVRQAWYSKEAVFQLPFTIAEGLAVKHGIPREEFLVKIQPRMTLQEKLRTQRSGVVEMDLGRASLTKLALYALTLEQLDTSVSEALLRAALPIVRRLPWTLGKVAAVLDNSYSTSGSNEKKRRPLGIAWAVDRVLCAAAREYRPYWTSPGCGELPRARGATDLATPLIAALETSPELLVIVSDAVDNDPPGGAAAVLRLWRTRLDPLCRTVIVHLNPVFAANDYAPRSFDSAIPTIGLRDAESLPMALAFARFASGTVTRADLEQYLNECVAAFLAERREVSDVE